MAMTAQGMRARYAADAVGTASPARLLTMLYDRLIRDLIVAEAAITEGAVQDAHDRWSTARRSSKSCPPASTSTPGTAPPASPSSTFTSPASW